VDAETVTYIILATVGGAIAGAYGFLILVPAWSAYGRTWEKLAAGVLTLFVLAAFAGAGLAAGLVLVYFWDSITGLFGALPRIF
jgi:hypothetical protein